MASNGGLCSAFWFFSQKINTSLPLSIPYVVGSSVLTQRCLLTILSKRFLPHSGKIFLGFNLHIWPPMVVFVQPFSFFSKNYHFSSSVNSLCNWALSSHSKVLAYYIPSKQFHTVDKKDFEFWLAHMASNRSFLSLFGLVHVGVYSFIQNQPLLSQFLA